MQTTTIPYVKLAPVVRPACSTEGMRRIECQDCGRLLAYAHELPAGRGVQVKCRCKGITLAWGDTITTTT